MDLWAAQTQARGFILLLFAVKVAFLLSLSKQEKRAARVQWPSFLQAGMPLSGCHIGHSTATSELRGPFAGVGGQMESGCAAQPSSTGIQPLLSSLPVPCLFIYSFSQAFLFALTLSQCCPTFHSQMFSFLLFFCFGYSLNKDIYYAHTPSVAHTGVFVLEDCNVKAVVPTFWLKSKGIKSAVMASKSGLPGFGRILEFWKCCLLFVLHENCTHHSFEPKPTEQITDHCVCHLVFLHSVWS